MNMNEYNNLGEAERFKAVLENISEDHLIDFYETHVDLKDELFVSAEALNTLFDRKYFSSDQERTALSLIANRFAEENPCAFMSDNEDLFIDNLDE